MAYEIPVLIKGFKANSDLSAAANKFKFVKFTADDTVDVCSAATDKPAGVLQNTPKLGATAEVMMIGVTKVQADEALAAGDLIGPSADGQADKKTVGTDVTHYIAGQVMAGAANVGELATALINCANIARAA